MKSKKIFLALLSLFLLCAVTFHSVGCGTTVHAADLMAGIASQRVDAEGNLDDGNLAMTSFAVRLFKSANQTGNSTLISPLSVLYALAMVANGADGNTRAQMEEVLGMGVEELNLYLYSYMNSLSESENSKLSLANSIWFTEDARFTVDRSFLQTNADYYGAGIYKAPFNGRTVRDINNWVQTETDGMIPKIVDEIPEEAVMYLVNALAFEADWPKAYEKDQVRDGTFTKEDGTERDVELMYGTVGQYLADENATGFIKPYKGLNYAFVALLPNEGVSVSEYVATLNGASLHAMLENAESVAVRTAIPKFENEYTAELSDVLSAMGMTDAFDLQYADFEGIGTWEDGNICIGEILHKTYIEVGEKGTRAGAVTSIRVDGAASGDPGKPMEVYLDRPFVYMLIDCENNIPFFIGTVMDVK